MKFRIAGLPATFATKGEKSWKDTLFLNLLKPIPNEYIGLHMLFVLPTLTPYGHPLDVDNLCEPVFSVLVNRIGWFQGKRSNIRFWRASKSIGADPGAEIELFDKIGSEEQTETGHVIFNAVYSGVLPVKARSPELPDWLNGLHFNCPMDCPLSLDLSFGSDKINLGDISTGKIKPIIDCLYPIIGGIAGAPADWRFHEVGVRKGVPGLQENDVAILIRALP